MTCAYAVRGALKKFAGVESVDVSLNKGLATVKLKPGNSITAEQLWEAVRKNGFTPKETFVIVRGEVVGSQLKVSGTGRTYDLVSADVSEVKGRAGQTIVVEGVLPPPTKGAPLAQIRVKKVQ